MPAASHSEALMHYFLFLRENWRFVGFGVFLTFLSSFGQTFYVALYGGDIRAEYGLSHGGFGTVFSGASIASALALVWVGKLIDRVELRAYTAACLAAMFAAMAAIAFVPGVAAFAVAIFVVRFCGQGLCVHISSTSMARYFSRDRGKALSIAGMGLAFGEAFLPAVTVVLIAMVGWHQGWLVTAAAVALLSLLLLPFLLKGQTARHVDYLARLRRDSEAGGAPTGWTRRQVLADPVFYAVMALLLAFPYMATAVFFHQAYIAEARGWPLELLAGGFVVLALLKVMTSLMLGPLIDRYGATALVPAAALPLAAAMLAILASHDPAVPFVYLGLFGVSIGMLQPIMASMLAERYGIAHLGGIRAMAIAAMVFAAAAAPASVGWMLDGGIRIDAIVAGFLAYVVVTAAMAALALRRERGKGGISAG